MVNRTGQNRAKEVLISGYIGFSNFGDDAILSSLVEHLKEMECDVSALSANPELTKENFDIFTYKFNNIPQIFYAIKNNDILVSGGGSLLQNVTSNKSLIYYLLIIFLAKIFNKKVVIFAQGIGPIKGKFYQGLTKNILKICDVVTVRNSFSQRLLSKWKINSKLVIDPVLEISTPPYDPKGIVGVQLRPYAFLESNFVKNLAKKITEKFSDRKIQIFPFQKKLDEEICNEFYELLKKENPQIDAEIIEYQSIEQINECFSHLEYLFAMRFHACILGLKSGVKTLPLSYDEKVVNLAQDFGIDYVEASEKVDFEVPVSKLINENWEPLTVRGIRGMGEIKFDWEYFAQVFGRMN